jgi:hypothetical protein
MVLQAEQREKERRQKEKQEAHLYCHVRIATDQDIAEQVSGIGAAAAGWQWCPVGGSCQVSLGCHQLSSKRIDKCEGERVRRVVFGNPHLVRQGGEDLD